MKKLLISLLLFSSIADSQPLIRYSGLTAQINTVTSNNDTIYVFGDSYSNPGAFSNTLATSYPYVVGNMLGANVGNLGVNGQRMQTLSGGDNSSITHLNTLPNKTAKGRYIVIELGLNDILHQDTYDSAGFRRDCKKTLDTLTLARGWPANKIILCTVPFQTPSAKASTFVIAGMQVAYNTIISQIAAQYGVLLCDLYTYESNHGGASLIWSVDSVHMNDMGHRVVGSAIVKTIAANSPVLPTQNKSQAFAVNGTSEFNDIIFHTSNVLNPYNFALIGVDSAAHFGITHDVAYLNANSLKAQGGNLSITGRIISGDYPYTVEPEFLLSGGGAKADYFRTSSKQTAQTGMQSTSLSTEGPGMEMWMLNTNTGVLQSFDHTLGTGVFGSNLNLFVQPYGGKVSVLDNNLPTDGASIKLAASTSITGGIRSTALFTPTSGESLEFTYDQFNHIGLINAYDRTGVAAKPINLQRGGGNVWIGTGTSDPSGSLLTVQGSFATNINATAKTTGYTITASDYTIRADATSGAFNVTLPTAIGCQGRIYIIKRINSGANAVTVNTTSSQTIDGATTYGLSAQYKYVTIQSNNVNWEIIGNN